jgi:folylpolyglutamate synthase/dihydropteroate synthase
VRTKPVADLRDAVLAAAPGARPRLYQALDEAIAGAAGEAAADDCVLVFGSFMTVEAALRSPWVASV